MIRDVRPKPAWSVGFLTAILAWNQLPSFGSGSEREETRLDCGVLALHTLLALEGRETTLGTIEAALPPSPVGGYSLAQLQDAARTCGLSLDGLQLARGKRAPDRPALLHLKRGPHGHFVVVRPVGHSGQLVQVLDVAEEPFVTDAAEISASPEWTGLALVPRRRAWVTQVGYLWFAACLCGAILMCRKPAHVRSATKP